MKISLGQKLLRAGLGLFLCFALAAMALVFSGCRPAPKPVAPESAAPASPAVATAAAPVAAHEPPPPVPAKVSEPAPQSIHAMEKVLVGYMISQHRRPQSFEEFVAATKIQAPPPPPGKKYVIGKNMHILLVDK